MAASVSSQRGRAAARALWLAVCMAGAFTAAHAEGGAREAQRGAGWVSLDPKTCTALSAEDQARLPAAWKPYVAAARRCELTPPKAGSAVKGRRAASAPLAADGASTASTTSIAPISLISIFADEYYRGRPADAAWEDFPKPLLVDRQFRCVGTLSELYPIDQPRELHLRHGGWRDGLPQEIRVAVKDPAVGGDDALPVLRWLPAEQRYQAATAARCSA